MTMFCTKGQLFGRFLSLSQPDGPRQLGASPLNAERNRYGNILPYDHWRVSLLDYEVGDNDYINASPILMAAPRGQSPLHIATQGPTPPTFEAFWAMAWQQQATAVVQATEFIDGSAKLCDIYLPLEMGEHQDYGAYRVHCLDLRGEAIERRHLRITHGGKTRDLIHLHFRHWVDFAAPEVVEIHGLLKCMETHAGDGPFIIHCSAGVGRAGTVLVALALFNRFKMGEKAPSIEELDALIVGMRHQRRGIVQDVRQYLALYGLRNLLWDLNAP